jgi:redox-sensitive bicupin YhaK (pirin superfamily)
MYDSVIARNFINGAPFQYFQAETFPRLHPVHWLRTHFAVGGPSPLQRLSGMLTAHMTRIAPRSGFTWHPHRGLEIYTWMLEGTLHHEDSTGGEGNLQAGDIQRMFSGDWIEHQELNLTDEPVRLIQIWFVADYAHHGVAPHYQQVNRTQLPKRAVGEATVWSLIGADSPLEAHIRQGRLTAADLPANGQTVAEAPQVGENLFLYVTDGAGQARYNNQTVSLGQYDVILARPEAEPLTLTAAADRPLHYLSFYLASFLN